MRNSLLNLAVLGSVFLILPQVAVASSGCHSQSGTVFVPAGSMLESLYPGRYSSIVTTQDQYFRFASFCSGVTVQSYFINIGEKMYVYNPGW
jgi:hypothetical protein